MKLLNDFLVFSCKFIIDLKQLLVNNGTLSIEDLYSDSRLRLRLRLASLEGVTTTEDASTIQSVNLCISAYSLIPTTPFGSGVIDFNLEHNWNGAGSLDYLAHKSGFCVYKDSRIRITNID